MNILDTILALKTWLQGKKTNIICLVGLVVVALEIFGYIPADTSSKILQLLGVTVVATMGAKIQRGINFLSRPYNA